MLLLNKVFGVNYLVAAAIGFSAGLALIYALSIRYVFGDNRSLRPSRRWRALSLPACSACS